MSVDLTLEIAQTLIRRELGVSFRVREIELDDDGFSYEMFLGNFLVCVFEDWYCHDGMYICMTISDSFSGLSGRIYTYYDPSTLERVNISEEVVF